MHIHMCTSVSVTAPVLLHNHRKGCNRRSCIALTTLDVLGHGDEAGNGLCVLGGDKREKYRPPVGEVQVQELGVVSEPRRGLCTDAPG